MVAHSLRAEYDGSEDGTGRGTPLILAALAFGGNNTSGPIDVSTACQAHRGPHGRQDFGSETFVLERTGGGFDDAIAFSCKDHGADAGEVAPTLRSMEFDATHANGGGQVAVAFHNRQYPDVWGDVTHPIGREDNGLGILTGDPYASTQEADSTSVLSALRDRAGAEAVAEWGSRILDSLQSPEVLRAWLHGEGLRQSSGEFKSFVDDRPLPREEGEAARAMRVVWENGPDGRTPQGRGLAKQLAHELGEALPILPPQVASLQPAMQVRRLTPTECERLMGFPDGWTEVPYRGKPAADGPRYKALGNSMAVNCMSWIGDRIQQSVERNGG